MDTFPIPYKYNENFDLYNPFKNYISVNHPKSWNEVEGVIKRAQELRN